MTEGIYKCALLAYKYEVCPKNNGNDFFAQQSGSNAGIAVFHHKEPVLKGINCNCMYVQ